MKSSGCIGDVQCKMWAPSSPSQSSWVNEVELWFVRIESDVAAQAEKISHEDSRKYIVSLIGSRVGSALRFCSASRRIGCNFLLNQRYILPELEAFVAFRSNIGENLTIKRHATGEQKKAPAYVFWIGASEKP